jgi:hypothetical protein
MTYFNLYLEYYESTDLIRNNEVISTIKKNVQSKLFHNIFIFTEIENFRIDGSNVIHTSKRMTYSNFINFSNDYLKDKNPNEWVNIIANSDILFNDTILMAKNISEKEFYAITRYDSSGKIHKNNWNIFWFSDSQDTWVLRGQCTLIGGDFSLGVPGCDAKIAYDFFKSGYIVSNPSLSIITTHIHFCSRRGSSGNNSLRLKRPYLIIKPTKIGTWTPFKSMILY